jgi:glucosyl-3-phosphoglycerate phosphatase
MTARTIVLWRHGQTEFNATARMQGQTDVPLNEHGLAHAARAAAVLVELRPTAIVSSDLSRASSTAAMLGELTGLDVGLDARLRERSFGLFEGLTRPEMEDRWPEAFSRWRRGEEVAEVGIEPRATVGERVASAVVEHAAVRADDDVLVVVGHGSALAAGVTRLVGLGPDGWYGLAGMDNCHWAVLRANRGRHPEWVLTSYNVGVL